MARPGAGSSCVTLVPAYLACPPLLPPNPHPPAHSTAAPALTLPAAYTWRDLGPRQPPSLERKLPTIAEACHGAGGSETVRMGWEVKFQSDLTNLVSPIVFLAGCSLCPKSQAHMLCPVPLLPIRSRAQGSFSVKPSLVILFKTEHRLPFTHTHMCTVTRAHAHAHTHLRTATPENSPPFLSCSVFLLSTDWQSVDILASCTRM